MSRFRSKWPVLPLVLLCFCSGCLFTHHSTNVVRQHEPRREVRFESLAAQQAFNAKAYDDKTRQEAVKTKVFAVPFLLWYSKTDVMSENAQYNDQVAACDADGDGAIGVREAVAYNPKSASAGSNVAQSKPDPSPAPSPVQPASLQPPADAPTPESVLR